MGHNSSLPRVDAFSPEEVQRLEKRFHKLDLDRSGTISIGEFVSVPELKENPLVKRVVDIFDSDLNGEVDFKGKTIERASILFFHVPYIITYLVISNLLILVSQSLKENEKLLKFAMQRHDTFAIRIFSIFSFQNLSWVWLSSAKVRAMIYAFSSSSAFMTWIVMDTFPMENCSRYCNTFHTYHACVHCKIDRPSILISTVCPRKFCAVLHFVILWFFYFQHTHHIADNDFIITNRFSI